MGKRFDPEIWGTKDDVKRAAESAAVAVKGLAKDLVGADSSAERKRLDELCDEADQPTDEGDR